MSIELFTIVIEASLRAATPLLLAGVGILVLERSGLLNLGQEGVLSFAAVIAFIAVAMTGSYFLALFFSMASGMLLVCLFGLLVFVFKANQIVSGLMLSILGIGITAFIGSPFIGTSIEALPQVRFDSLAEIPIVGPVLFDIDTLMVFSWVLVGFGAFFIYRTKSGLIVRAVGDDAVAAKTLGYSPKLVQFYCLLFSGASVGLAGAYLPLVYTQIWTEGMSSGRGWIALALVVFASHRFGRLGLGALLFGFTSIIHLLLQGGALDISSSLLAMTPYLITIFALVIISYKHSKKY